MAVKATYGQNLRIKPFIVHKITKSNKVTFPYTENLNMKSQIPKTLENQRFLKGKKLTTPAPHKKLSLIHTFAEGFHRKPTSNNSLGCLLMKIWEYNIFLTKPSIEVFSTEIGHVVFEYKHTPPIFHGRI